jgi:small nuclear ribonucleoprotein (snRNP)-like protein
MSSQQSPQQEASSTAAPFTKQQEQQQQQKLALDYAKSILGQPITCTLDDGRTVQGKFLCIDRLRNIILTNVVERRTIQTSDYRFGDESHDPEDASTNKTLPVERHLGQAMVPGSRLVKVEIEKSIHEEKMKCLADGL